MSELEKFGGWPLLEGDNWKEKNFSWNMASEFMKNGHNWGYIFGLKVSEDRKNSTRRVIYVGRGSLRLPDEVFLMVSVQSNLEHLQHFAVFIVFIQESPDVTVLIQKYRELIKVRGEYEKFLISEGCCSSWWRPKGGTLG